MKTQRQVQHEAASALTLIPEELLQPFAHAAPQASPSDAPPDVSHSEPAAASVDQPDQKTSVDGNSSPTSE
jgi:hypothetical protein